jgi:hypothetical protein
MVLLMLIVGSLAGRSLDLTQAGRVPAAAVGVDQHVVCFRIGG